VGPNEPRIYYAHWRYLANTMDRSMRRRRCGLSDAATITIATFFVWCRGLGIRVPDIGSPFSSNSLDPAALYLTLTVRPNARCCC